MRHERIPDTSLCSDPEFQVKESALRIIIPANEKSVRRGLHSMKAGLSGLNLSPDDWGTVEIVIAEVLNNIVEHAYSERNGGVIETHLSYSGESLSCAISDTGRPMPNGKLPDGAQKNLDCDIADLPEGGFGWFLIHHLTHDLYYGRDNGRNTVTFRLQFGATP
jgi:serine/threonine-protein kinase RsbW